MICKNTKPIIMVIKCSLITILYGISGFLSITHAVDVVEDITLQQSPYYIERQLNYSTGESISSQLINGPPTPPSGYDVQRQASSLPKPDVAMGINTLTNVPAYNWVFGCTSVSASMISGYYDRIGWSNMYTGPTSGGVMPLDNSFWPTWSDGVKTYPNIPLAASKQGVDGFLTKGSINDYWVSYGSTTQDPYITGSWSQHAWGTAVGDYMKTSQSTYGNTDGATSFYNFTGASPLTCAVMPTYNSAISGLKISDIDGTYGRKLFYEARGYTVNTCYNQKTDNQYAGGFSFAQYMVEIDAGRPVMLNLQGHTIVGIGYDSSTNMVYLHDTWDYSNHTMTWGGSYSGMALDSVSIVNINPDSSGGGGSGLLTGLSTQGRVGINNEQLFGTFTVGGDSRKVLVRGLGQTLGDYNTPGWITDPKITLTPNGSTTVIASNDNWEQNTDAVKQEMISKKYNPKYPSESALLIVLQPGIYNVYMSPATGAMGVGMLEVFPK